MTSEEPTRSAHHKRICLPLDSYAQPGMVWSVTIGVPDRRPVFADPRVASAAVAVLRERAEVTGVAIHGYCVMPDQLHLVLSPPSTTDVVTSVGQAKNLVQRAAWKLDIQGSFWQNAIWDHALRADESFEAAVEYVLGNPVRRGLVAEGREYPHAGSIVFDLGRG